MKLSFRITLCFFSAFICISCSQSEQRLTRLEKRLRDNPDSVFTELKSIPTKHLNKREAAYHALLMTAAMDMNLQTYQNDSLIDIAANYFFKTHDIHKKMMSYYYKGLVKRDLGQFAESILLLEEAAFLAEKDSDPLYQGLSYRSLSEIYSFQFEDIEAENNIKKSISVFEAANLKEYAESARNEFAEILQQQGKDNQADSVFRLVISNAQEYPLVNQAYCSYAYLMDVHDKDDAIKVLDLFKKGGLFGYGSGELAKMAYAYSFFNKQKSDSLIQKAYHSAVDQIDTARVYYHMYLIEKKEGNYEKALTYHTKEIEIQNRVTRMKLQQSLMSSLNDIYRRDNQLQQLKHQSARRNFAFILVIILSGTGILAWRLIVKSRKNRDLSESIAETRRILQEREDGNLRLAKALVLEKIDQVQHAQERYMAAQGSEEEQAAYMDFRKQLGLLKNDRRLYANLATVLDEQHDGIATKVREDFPKMTDNNYELLLLLLAHFPQSTILLLKDATPGSLKTAKSRLRSALRKSDSPRKETYLSMLDN